MSRLAAAVLACFVAGGAASAEPKTSGQAGWDELEKLAAAAPEVGSYAADFVQEKFTPLLREPIVSRGRVRIAGGTSRWDTDTPYASTMLIADGELRLYYPEQQTLEVYALGDRLDALAASPVPDLAVLRENFDLDASAWNDDRSGLTVTMVPKTDEIAEAIEEVVVEIDPTLGALRRMSLTDLDGETTALRFENIRLNPEGLDGSDLALQLPGDTKVVRPLEAVGG